jgi:hypothetical protein
VCSFKTINRVFETEFKPQLKDIPNFFVIGECKDQNCELLFNYNGKLSDIGNVESELIRVKKDNPTSVDNPTDNLVERMVTVSQLSKIIELLGEDLYNITESQVDDIMNQYP